jgi:hypothetical protein
LTITMTLISNLLLVASRAPDGLDRI